MSQNLHLRLDNSCALNVCKRCPPHCLQTFEWIPSGCNTRPLELFRLIPFLVGSTGVDAGVDRS